MTLLSCGGDVSVFTGGGGTGAAGGTTGKVTGRVTEVPVEPNRLVKKGQVLFKIDPVPFELKVKAAQANVEQLRAKLIGSRANQRTYEEQLKEITSTPRTA